MHKSQPSIIGLSLVAFVLLLGMFAIPPLSTRAQEDDCFSVYYGYEQIATAKRLALENNRPLLFIASIKGCVYCDYIEKNIIQTETFREFARTNKIIVVSTVNDRLETDTYYAYKTGYKVNFDGTPIVYMFKVKEGANLETVSSKAFAKTEVEPVKSTVLNTYFMGSYPPDNPKAPDPSNPQKAFMGIYCGTKDEWNPHTFIAQIKVAFPNQFWDTLAPEITPDGYEGATDIGTIYNTTYKPPRSVASITNLGTMTYKGLETEKWYKFTGRPGQRFSMYGAGLNAASGELAYTIDVFACNTTTGKPVEPPIASFKDKSYNYLNGNFHFDVPASDKATEPYYLRIVAKGASPTDSATFSLRIHETQSNPEVGHITNPLWKGAQKGKWSMDIDAVLEAAYTTDTPVLIYFGAVTWCPKCVCLEQNVLSTPEFAEALSHYYALDFDYRLRSADDSTGPCLLTETDGYRADNPTITDEDMWAQLRAIRAWQEKLSLHNVPKTGWDKGAIPYPTLVFCRVKATTRGDYDLEPVGRFPYYPLPEPDDMYVKITVEETLEALALFQGLYDVDYAESATSRDTSYEALDPTAPSATAYVGDHNDTYWAQFPLDGSTWSFHIQSDDATPDATATVCIYDILGASRFIQITGSLQEGISFDFTPETTDETFAWLSIQVNNQKTLATLNIQYALLDVTAFATLPNAEIALPHTSPTAQIPVNLRLLQANDKELAFQYRVFSPKTRSSAPLDDDFFTALDWTDFPWADKALTTDFISVPLAIPANASWEGTRDFTVEIRQKENNSCHVEGNTSTTVRIATTPQFLPKLEQTSFTLYTGLQNSITIPVCPTANTTILTSPLPNGLAYEIPDDHSFIRIFGRPNTATTKPKTVTLSLKQANTVVDTVTLSLTIEPINLDALTKKAFTATLFRENSTTPSIDGTLLIARNAAGSLDITLNTLDTTANATIPDWSYDASSNHLFLDCTLSDNTSLTVNLEDDGNGTVELLTGTNHWSYAGDLHPVATASPEEFKGLYNIVIRQYDDYDGSSLGWAQLTVADDATALLSINLYGTAPFTIPSCIYYDASSQLYHIPYFAPLYKNKQNGFDGRIGGVLDIIPLSERSTDFDDTWITGCDTVDSLYTEASGLTIKLLQCGTIFTPNTPITNHTGTNSYLFFADNVASPDIITPAVIPLMEFADDARDTFAPVISGPYSDNLSNLVINPENGLFTLNLNLLENNGNGKLTPIPVQVSGIFVPTTVACCGITDNIAIAYGAFNYNGLFYSVRLFPEEEYHLTQLSVNTPVHTSPTISVKCTLSNSANLFYQRLDTEEIFVKLVKNGTTTLSGLDDTTPWRISAVATINAAFYAESLPTALPAYQGTQTYSFSTDAPEGSAERLEPGWNLVAIPENLAIAAEGALLPKCLLTFDENTNSYVHVNSLTPGQAYWLFVADPLQDRLSFKATPIAHYAQREIPPGWSLRASPADSNGLQMWKLDNNQYTPVVEPIPAGSPVFIFK